MKAVKILFKSWITLCFAFLLIIGNLGSEEKKIQSIVDQIDIISQDLKTLEKAVYKKSDITNKISSNNLNEDILTIHLIKLNEIESQFRDLTNRFEEVSFKLDKLSNRVSKIQSDSQLRFNDLESATLNLNDRVKIISGKLINKKGKIIKLCSHDRVKILLESLSGKVTAILGKGLIYKV